MGRPAKQAHEDLAKLYSFDQNTTDLTYYVLDRTGLHERPSFSEAIQNPQPALAEILHGHGDGYSISPLSVKRQDFLELCSIWRISPHLIRNFGAYGYHQFEYHLEMIPAVDGGKERPKSLDLFFQQTIGLVSLMHVEFDPQMSVKCLIFEKFPHANPAVMASITQNVDHLIANAVEIIPLLMGNMAYEVSLQVDTFIADLNRLEARLGVTSPGHRKWLLSLGHSIEPDLNYRVLNEDIYDLQRRIIVCENDIYVLRTHSKTCQSIQEELNGINWSNTALRNIHSILRSTEINIAQMNRLKGIMANQATVLFNLINQRDARLTHSLAESSRTLAAASRRDSLATKTIAILTLAFLPATFVSAVFSTSIFDFSNTVTSRFGTVSDAWWIYMLSCLLLTMFTAAAWGLWIWFRLKEEALVSEKEKAELAGE